ncbi:MAG TPA: nuclear transport factor 2 family protein [Pyrinomonadaceae bacterium]
MLTTPEKFSRRFFLNRSGTSLGAALIGLAAAQTLTGRVVAAAPLKLEKVVDEFYAAYMALDAGRLLALLADDCFFEDPTFHLKAQGKAEIRKLMEGLLGHYSNIKIELENRIVCGNWVVTQQHFSGLSKSGPGAEGRQISVRGASVFGFEKERIRRWTDYYDFATFARQSGLKSN